MVVRFAIEPDALLEDSYYSPRDMKNHHKRLIRLWEQYGLLLDPGKGPDSVTSIFDSHAFRRVRAIWQEAWKTKNRCRRAKTEGDNHIRWDNLNSEADLARYEHLIELALVETYRGIVCLGIPEEDEDDRGNNLYSNFCGAVEAAFFKFPEESHSFQDIMNLSKKTVLPAGQQRGKMWSTWFQKLAQKSKEVVIIDRYGFSKHGLRGICWALDSLRGSMSEGNVSIFSSNPSTLAGSSASESEILNRIGTVLAGEPGKLKTVTVFLLANREMTKDRFIRFDECAFSIGHGVSEAFAREYLDREMPCILDTHPRGLLRIMRNEVQRLIGKSHKKLQFADGKNVKTEEVVK